MKHRLALVMACALAILSFSGVAYAAESEDYIAGYLAGVEFYERYGGAYSAWEAYYIHIASSKFDYKPVDEKDGWALYKEGFQKGYSDAVEGITVSVNYASDLGSLLGEVYARRDYNKGNKSNWAKAMPTDSSVVSMFNLTMLGVEYRKEFLDQFEEAFKESYLKAYEEALLEPKKVSISQGFEDGQSVGAAVGATFGERDYLLGFRLNYKRNLPSETSITKDFRLDLDSKEYKDAFIQGYISGYESAYNESYRSTAQRDAENKSISALIPVSGGSATLEGNITVTVPAGALYSPAYLMIENVTQSYLYTSYYVQASQIYKVSINDVNYTMDKSKPITIEFPYYGDPLKGGIYRYVNGRWLYIPSRAVGGKISASIEPGTLSGVGHIYAVFADNGARAFPDARSHWAKDEINTMLRRGVVTGYSDGTFKPDNNVTRLDFLAMLSRAYQWPSGSYGSYASGFKDYHKFKDYAGPVGYAYTMGYVKGYSDGNFRPYDPISYNEVQTIMRRVLRDTGFSWETIATQMMYDKAVKSASFASYNNKITRAEVVYMLYSLSSRIY